MNNFGSSRRKIQIISAVCIVSAIILGGLAYWYFVFNSPKNIAGRISSNFIAGLYSTNQNTAYQMATKRLQLGKDKTNFFVPDSAAVNIHKVTNTVVEKLKSDQIGVEGTFSGDQDQFDKLNDKEPSQKIDGKFALILANESGKWKVDAYVVK